MADTLSEAGGTQANLASIALDSTMLNGIAASMFAGKTMRIPLDLQSLVLELSSQIEQMKVGDKSKTEAILLSQVFTLNAIFVEMSRRAALNINEHIHATEAYMRMALKAQNQVRLTLETVSAMSNPPVVIAKQANIATNQQVNNVLVNSSMDGSQNLPTQHSGEMHELCQDP